MSAAARRPPAASRAPGGAVRVRRTRPADFDAVIALCRGVYPDNPPYSREMLRSHLEVFPAGQLSALVALPGGGSRLVGMAASLIIDWDDYDVEHGWRDFTDHGWFTNHDPRGRTLYGAEVMVDPAVQGEGVGSRLYDARDGLLRRLGLLRIRAGARLRGYRGHAARLTPEAYVAEVVAGRLRDPTLTFQLHRGFRVLSVVSGYLPNDPYSLGHAAVIEKLNPELVRAG